MESKVFKLMLELLKEVKSEVDLNKSDFKNAWSMLGAFAVSEREKKTTRNTRLYNSW